LFFESWPTIPGKRAEEASAKHLALLHLEFPQATGSKSIEPSLPLELEQERTPGMF